MSRGMAILLGLCLFFGVGYVSGEARVRSDQWTEKICAWITPSEDTPPAHYTCWNELHQGAK